MNYTQKSLDELTYQVLGAAIHVHKFLGPGLLESVYHQCLIAEFDYRSINYKSELSVPIIYRGQQLETLLRCDFLVEGVLVLELKSVNEILPIHQAQLMNYMNLLKAPKGILINFNVINLFQQGQKTFINKYFEKLDRF
ncbi:MAG TPA: GxxExxY protein [Algoriphagus sp.]|jgi:GxxExxY protein|uniref:GxxExxY protein n=1 Tax=unclassified Algoriphagus TaxID=2641541 RepID=UPI000C54E99E|nr:MULTISPECIES: GxxExxY protein [unclassified Algoriphagus]MAL12306.1 GxxExxY protein [Algoriphagus sp.]MAN88589.1 GxxExxY protein [Algoriphagus sp.]QYH40159.1 GxxExxY protein [Algoriphagus sp. NBT04N3]HAD50086.1 GxxExxY protein [Algoriphagus sp.]HAH35980.1 GxxExxY protein [Algoriphagus sp.]|tara:strand:- start:1277 stop:1693 length:417 start_codon:yes stop_codon:yes gene_type:complete